MNIKHTLAAVAIGSVVFLASYASAQSPSFQWARRVASTTNTDFEPAIGLAIDSAANLYVTGWFDGTNDFGGVILTNRPGDGQDIFVAKYNSSGTLQWARQAGSSLPDRDGGRGIGLDSAGNVYVTGEFVGYADFDGIALSGSAEKLFFLAKYDNDGRIQWVRQSVGPQGHYGTGLAVDGAGNSHAVGYIDSLATMAFDGNISVINTNVDGYSTFLVKYNGDGNPQWARLISSPDQSYSTSVAVDGSGNVYVSGAFQGSLFIGNTNLTSAGVADGFLAKFNSAGDLQWVRQMSTTSYGGDPMGVGVDSSDGIYVAGGFGTSAGDTISFGPSITLTNIGGGISGLGVGDAFLVKYDGFTGTPQWALRTGGTNQDFYAGVRTDSHGNVYVGGVGGGIDGPNDFNAVVAKYDGNGVLQWTQASTGTNGLVFAGPVVDAAGNCYVAGWFQTNAVFGSHTLTGDGVWNFFLAKVGFAPFTLGIVWSNSMPWLSVSGEIGNRFVLEYVSGLPANNNWQSLVTNTLTSNPFAVPDTNTAGGPTRFYRARLVP